MFERHPRVPAVAALVAAALLVCSPQAAADPGRAPTSSASRPTKPASNPSDSSAAARDRARVLYEQGYQLLLTGKYEEARAALLAAWAIHQHWQIAGSLAEAELETGHARDAATHIAYAQRTADAKISIPQAGYLRELKERARQKVAEVRITVSAPHATVLVDRQTVGEAPLPDPVYVEPGARSFEATLFDRMSTKTSVLVQAGQTYEIALDFPNSHDAPAPSTGTTVATPLAAPAAAEGGAPAGRTWVVLGGAALTVAAGVTGFYLLDRASTRKSEADDARTRLTSVWGPNACNGSQNLATVGVCEQLQAASDEYHRNRVLGTMSLVAAGTFAVATAAVYLLWPQTSNSDSAARTQTRIAAVPWADGGSLQLAGEF